jgi:transposase
MRRVDCHTCATPVVEKVPWASGKQRSCDAYRLFLAFWAKHLPWARVASLFHAHWSVVYSSVRWVVNWGHAHLSLDEIRSIGIDEIAVWSGHRYLTLVYQLDEGHRRLLWAGKERTKAALERFFSLLGPTRARALQFVASDMWKPYLTVVKRWAPQAIHVLDRFHIVAKLNKALDQIRAQEARKLTARGFDTLKHTRWCFLKRPKNLTPTQSLKLGQVLRYDLRTVRGYLHKEAFDGLWKYSSAHWAGWFLDRWCTRVMRSRLTPLKRVALTLRRHRPLILNWFRAKGEISSAAVEGMNATAKLAIRKARGFRTLEALQVALYHQLGNLPEPSLGTHRFW